MIEENYYPQYSKNYPLLVKSFLKRPLTLIPDDDAIVYRDDNGKYFRFTWRQWHERTCQLAHALAKLGVRQGDKVATMALNHHWHMESIYAAICSGAVSHPINIRLSLDHMGYTITHGEDKVLLFDDILLPLVELLYDRIKTVVEKFIYISDKPGLPKTKVEPLYSYEDLIKDEAKTFSWPDLHEDTDAVLYYTTGTTGLPKGVLFTNRQIYLHCVHTIALAATAVRLPSDPERPNTPIPMMNVPLFHIHAWGAPFASVWGCAKIVFPGRFTPESFCELVQNEKVTGAMMVPTMLAMLLEYKDIDKWDLSSLLGIAIGGGALPLGLKKKAEKYFPQMRTGSGYGMTETMAGAIAAGVRRYMVDWPREDIDRVLVKTGLPFTPAIDARVIDEKGNDVPHDNATIGEIVLRGHWIMDRYYKDPEKSAQAWRDGWFHTGDVAKVDKDHYIVIADRITDVIRSGSEMIPTVLLENMTGNAPFVLEASYVGVPDDKWGEIPMALVKKMPGSSETEEDVIAFLQKEGVDEGKITKWMLPVYVAFVDDVPKTSVGKYDKIAIRSQLDYFRQRAKRMRDV